MTKKKANIAPEFVGKRYIFEGNVWTLNACGTEPRARMVRETGESFEGQLSEFKGFVRLEPVSPLPREKRKYTRHEKNEKFVTMITEHFVKDEEAKQSKFDVTKWHLKTPQGDEPYQSIYGKVIRTAITQRDATMDLLMKLGLPTQDAELKDFLATIPDCPEKTTLVNVLGG